MRRRARPQLLALLLLGAPLAAAAQSHERLSVEPSDPGQFVGVGYVDEVFVFTADVTEAVSYELHFGDGQKKTNIEPDADGKAIVRYPYTSAGRYTAQLFAWRDPDGAAIKLELDIEVREPPAPPRPVTKKVRFSVAKSDLAEQPDVRIPWADFTFTGVVSGAERYELYFGDGQFREDIGPTEMANAVRHEYAEPGSYTALLKARSNTGELTENELVVVVQKPPEPPETQALPEEPKEPEEPPVEQKTSEEPQKPQQKQPRIPWWILILAALALATAAYFGGMAAASSPDPIRFKPRVHPGTARVVGAVTAGNAVSMRIRRDAGRIEISKIEGEDQ